MFIAYYLYKVLGLWNTEWLVLSGIVSIRVLSFLSIEKTLIWKIVSRQLYCTKLGVFFFYSSYLLMYIPVFRMCFSVTSNRPQASEILLFGNKLSIHFLILEIKMFNELYQNLIDIIDSKGRNLRCLQNAFKTNRLHRY